MLHSQEMDGGGGGFGMAVSPTDARCTRSYQQTDAWPVPVWVSLVCWKVSHRDALSLFIPFVFPLESFQPHCLCSSSDREINLHDIWCGFKGMAIIGFWRGMLQVPHVGKKTKTDADIQVSCSTDTVLFSPLSFYVFLGPYVWTK